MNVYGSAIMNLKHCNYCLYNRDKNKYSMRIFLFTPDDLPYFKDQNSRDQTIKHARQLKDIDV